MESKLIHWLTPILEGAELGLDLKEASVGDVSDSNLTAGMGIPTIDGLGASGVWIHARNEQINIL